MSQINAANAMEIDPFHDASSRNTEIASEQRGGAVKELPNAVEDLGRFKQALKDTNLVPRAYKKLLKEAVDTIQRLLLMKVYHPQSSKSSHADEIPTMTKILQEIRSIKTTIAQNKGLSQIHGQTWAKMARKPEVAGSVIRIQDEKEKLEIAKLSSEELVKKIGINEVVGAKQLPNGQVKVYFVGPETKQIMDKQREWTSKLSATAQIASPTYQVLVHDIPFSFNPENLEQIRELEKANGRYIQGIGIQKAAWLRRNNRQGKSAGSLIVWFNDAECADRVIAKGLMWGYEVKATEIFRSGFRIMQCYNCQKYGHIARNCSVEPKCGQCAGGHNTRSCSGKGETRCTNCSKKHPAWDQTCPIRMAAKTRAVNNRTQDPGRFAAQEPQRTYQNTEWQIVGSRKRRAGTPTVEITNPVGEGIIRRGPGRPRKTPAPTPTPAFPETSETWKKLLDSADAPISFSKKANEPRPVTRENMAELNQAPECEISS